MARKSVKDKKMEETKESDSGSQEEDKKPHPPLSNKVSKSVDAIDDLLGSLSSDMEKMGVRTAAKGHCASCGKCIAGKVLATDNRFVIIMYCSLQITGEFSELTNLSPSLTILLSMFFCPCR